MLGNRATSAKGGIYYYSERGDRLIDLASLRDKLWQVGFSYIVFLVGLCILLETSENFGANSSLFLSEIQFCLSPVEQLRQ